MRSRPDSRFSPSVGGQGTFALRLAEDEIVFLADRWRPEDAIDGRYLWLPVEWEDGRPILRAP